MECDGCANANSEFCMICNTGEWFMTSEQKEWNDKMCDLMCGGVQDD